MLGDVLMLRHKSFCDTAIFRVRVERSPLPTSFDHTRFDHTPWHPDTINPMLTLRIVRANGWWEDVADVTINFRTEIASLSNQIIELLSCYTGVVENPDIAHFLLQSTLSLNVPAGVEPS